MNVQEYQIIDAPKPSEVKRPFFFHEIKSVVQPLRLATNYRGLTRAQKGNGQRVILFPGWKSPESSMYPMKNYLNTLGYAAEYWGLGFNNGKIEDYRDQLVEQLRAEDREDKMVLIGWSLGGVIAREIAREMPDRIAGVITYGTPIIGGPKYTIGALFWSAKETRRINDLLKELDKTNPIEVPMSIIFTKNDSFVSWPACLDSVSPKAKHYEVKSTHLSLGIDPEVWKIVGQHLAEYAE